MTEPCRLNFEPLTLMAFEDIPRTTFDDSRDVMAPDLTDRWEQIEVIYSEAERCQIYHKDENA